MKRPALSPAAEELAVQVAAMVAENIEPRLRKLVDDAFADWAPVCSCANPVVVDESPRVPTCPPLPGPDRRCVKCGRRAK
jgi:hypothetical protein